MYLAGEQDSARAAANTALCYKYTVKYRVTGKYRVATNTTHILQINKFVSSASNLCCLFLKTKTLNRIWHMLISGMRSCLGH